MFEFARAKGSRGRAWRYVALWGVVIIAPMSVAEAKDACGPLPQVSGYVELKEGCVYRAPILIASSGSTLDCRGAIIDGEGKIARGIQVGGDLPIYDITIKNCTIQRVTETGVMIRWAKRAAEVNRLARREAYAQAPKRIRLTKLRILEPPKVGLYVGEYATHIQIDDVSFVNFQTLAIYFEYSSQHNTVSRSKFTVLKKPIREAIAIDSSANNIIRNNEFSGPMPVALALYQNCQERITQHPDSPRRWLAAERNLIMGNVVKDAGIGIWIAARQSKDLKYLDCGSPSYGGGKYHRDWASRNIVAWNEFISVAEPVIVEDDDNTVVGNNMANEKVCIRVGSGPRTQFLGLPVKGTVVAGNTCSNSNGAIFEYGSTPAASNEVTAR